MAKIADGKGTPWWKRTALLRRPEEPAAPPEQVKPVIHPAVAKCNLYFSHAGPHVHTTDLEYYSYVFQCGKDVINVEGNRVSAQSGKFPTFYAALHDLVDQWEANPSWRRKDFTAAIADLEAEWY